MMPEILAQVTYVVASVATRYDVIAVTETVPIAAAQVTSQHHYWVLPTEDHNDPTVYRLPLNDSTYNTRQDWIAYRERFNFLQPTEIKAARQALGLTLREAAFIHKQRGDLVFYYQPGTHTIWHVAIYLGKGKVIESWPPRIMVQPIKNGQRSNVAGIARVFN